MSENLTVFLLIDIFLTFGFLSLYPIQDQPLRRQRLSFLGGQKCTTAMGKGSRRVSFVGRLFFLGGPLSEVPLYSSCQGPSRALINQRVGDSDSLFPFSQQLLVNSISFVRDSLQTAPFNTNSIKSCSSIVGISLSSGVP